MIYFPSCKINLGLHILKKRPDGFHQIESGMLEIPLRDVLEILPAEQFSFQSSGLEIPGEGNLCESAWRLLQRDFGLGEAAIHLHKVIPMGGGLGGGSSDAAQTLVAANKLYQLNLTDKQLETYAAELGSDCPFFIRGGLQLATGRGELLESLTIQLPKLFVVLVNHGIHVPTKTAYAAVQPNAERPPLKAILEQPIETWKNTLVNDFESSVFNQYPLLEQTKQELYAAGAVYAAMSGSGSTLFGLFRNNPGTIRWTRKPEFEKTLLL